MAKAKKRAYSPVVTEVVIVPANNGFTIKVEMEGFNCKRYVAGNILEVSNFLKTLNWGQDTKDKTLNDSLKSVEE
jgi:hypothetical protein